MFKESGVNHKARALTRVSRVVQIVRTATFGLFKVSTINVAQVEAKMIRTDLDCSLRVLDAFSMMLNFWGFRLVDPLTGEIKRNEDQRFAFR